MEHHQIVYAITDNIISSLGYTTAENMQNVLSGKSGVQTIDDKSLYVEPFLGSAIDRSVLRSKSFYSEIQNFHPLEQLMIASVKDALQHCDVDSTVMETIFIFSTTKGNIDLLADCNDVLPDDAYIYNMAQRVADFFNAANPPVVVSNACISGVLSPVIATNMLKTGKYTNAIIVGGDLLTEFIISGFESFKSVSSKPCRPYDMDRDGLNLGEAVATLVLSTDRSKVKDATPIMFAGGASSNDANHISGPSRTGEPLYFAMRDAMQEADVKPEEIDMMDAHGTATVYNDEMESKAIGLAGLQQTPLIGLKGYFGHTLGASGLMETIVCIESMRRKKMPKTLGFENTGTPVAVNVNAELRDVEIKNVLKTASGFGGCNAALVISTEKCGKVFRNFADIEVLRKCEISNKQVKMDGNLEYDGSENPDYGTFIRSAFKHISPEPYMKFPKMDDLCKLAVTATEYLLHDFSLEEYNERDVALLLTCRTSSLDTDMNHQSIINNKNPYQPSPAVFVYTLANIMQGEICIRHKIKGENICLVDNKQTDNRLVEYASMLFAQDRAKVCVVGYADFYRGQYKAQFSLMKQRLSI